MIKMKTSSKRTQTTDKWTVKDVILKIGAKTVDVVIDSVQVITMWF